MNFMNMKIPTSFYGLLLPEIFHTEYYRMAFKNGFPVAFNYSEIL